MKVLVIEDNQQVVKDISFCLQVRYPEVNVVSVTEGAKGLEMVETESPDLVMVASSLSDIDTLDLVSKIREFSDIPLIISTRWKTTWTELWAWRRGLMNMLPSRLALSSF